MAVLSVLNNREPAEKRWVTLAYILLTASMICGVASIGFYVANERSQSRARERDRIADTTDARYGACVGFNIEQEGDRASALNVVLVTFGLTDSGEITPAVREAIVSELEPDKQARYRQVEHQAARDNPFRDCSPSGINTYYEDPVPDPGATPTTTEE